MTTCPKCQSENVFVSQGGIGFESRLKIFHDNGWMVTTQDWMTILCADCGYFENYIYNADLLEKIKTGAWKNWTRVQ